MSYQVSADEYQAAPSTDNAILWLEDRLRSIDLPSDERAVFVRCLMAFDAIKSHGPAFVGFFDEEFELPPWVGQAAGFVEAQ